MSEAEVKKNWFVKHKILTVIIALVIIGGVANAANGGKTSTSTGTNDNAAKTTDSKTVVVAKIGEVAKDGKFDFTVTSLECGKTSAGTNQYLTKEAQGQYCFVNVNVKNSGNEAQTFDSSSQYLFDAANAKYSADSTASMYANPQGSTFLNSINPGNSVDGILVFDLPKDKTPITAELHDSLFSGGVKVNLQ